MVEVPFPVQLLVAGLAGFVLGFGVGWVVESARLRWIDRNQPPPF